MNNIMLNLNDSIYKMIHKELTSVLESVPNHRVIMANAVGKEGFSNYLHESNVVITDGYYFKEDGEFVQELNKLISRGRKTVIVINYESFNKNRIEQEFIDELIKNGILRVCNVKNGESLDFEYIKLLLTKEPSSYQLKGFLGYTDDDYSDFYVRQSRKSNMKTEMESFKNPQATLDMDIDYLVNEFILEEDDEIEEEVYVASYDEFDYAPTVFEDIEDDMLDNVQVASAIEASDEVMNIYSKVKEEEELAELGIVIEEEIEEEVLPQAEFEFEFNLNSLNNEVHKAKEGPKEELPSIEEVAKEVVKAAPKAEVKVETSTEAPVAKKPKKPKKKKKPVEQQKPQIKSMEKPVAVAEIATIPEIKVIEPVVVEEKKVTLVEKEKVNKDANRGPKFFEGQKLVEPTKAIIKEEKVMPKQEETPVKKEQVAPAVLNKTTQNFGENVRFMLRLNNVNPIMESLDYEKVLIIHLEVDQTLKYNLQSLDNILGSRMVNLDILSSNIMIEKNNYNDRMNVIYRLYDTNNVIDYSLLSNYIEEYTKEHTDTKVIVISDQKQNIHKFNKLFKYVNITCGDNTNELMKGMKIKEELLTSKHNVTLNMFSGTEHLIKDGKIGKKVPKVVKIK